MEAIRRVFFGCVASEPQVKNGPARPNADIYAKWDQKEMNGSIRGPVQGSVQQVTEDGQNEPAVHLTVVVDTSEAMTGPPAKAIAKGIRFLLLRHLQPTDVLTIWKFDESGPSRPVHSEAQHFVGWCPSSNPKSSAHKKDSVALYESIVAAVEDLESQGDRPLVVKPLLVLTDYHDSYGAAGAFEAKNALLWCHIPHMYPVLVSLGDPDVFEDVKQTKTREVFVESTTDKDLHKAFQVASEHLQAILKQAVEDVEF